MGVKAEHQIKYLIDYFLKVNFDLKELCNLHDSM